MTAWDAERWHAATGELDVMLGRDPAERAAALAVLRARDPRLADDVAQLLRDHDAAHAAGFLEQGPTALLTTTSPGSAPGPRPGQRPAALPPDATFGGYRVKRVLGRGGMGVVYEAEEIESGRRVALKVLEQRFGDERERERFEREGRLAASIDHEHCVFVFGAAEIDGTPAIAMELMQGTLADRLSASGPLSPAAAVDMTLQLVAGLQAAGDAGILHRDVKPSNCFVDANGVVKIGDFGISRSLRPAEETALSTRNQLAATPTYASPEQLRGGALDARTDIYSLGATLYELVTGRRPFSAPDLMSLLMAVANDAPPAPHGIAPGVPAGLSRVILRCLAKKPEDRYASYDALATALEPYSSASPTPATMGRRFVAGLIDYMAVAALTVPVTLVVLVPWLSNPTWGATVLSMAFSQALFFLYYGGSESRWARTPGKALLGLTLVDREGRPPRPAVVFARTLVFAAPNLLFGLGFLAIWGPGVPALATETTRINSITSIGQMLILATIFCTARRRNGYAALHDLATGCRVVERRVATAADRPAVVSAAAGLHRAAIGARGPFTLLDGEIDGRPGWRPGVDDRLRRPVWIRDVPVGTPPVSASRASLARPTRLRWLAGRRTAEEAWDVYEGVAGLPVAAACRQPRPWSEVRRWLADLAQELAARRSDDRPPLELDRVWILESGRAKLLDDPAVDADRAAGSLTDALALLAGVARLARTDQSEPWPASAARFVDGLAALPPVPLTEVARAAEALARGRAEITRGWRGLSIGGLVAAPALLSLITLGGFAVMTVAARNARPDDLAVASVLRAIERNGSRALAPADREAAEIVLAGRYRQTLSDPSFYKPERFLLVTPAHKVVADAILRRHDDAAAVERAAARPVVRKLFEDGRSPELPPVAPIAVMLIAGLLTAVALFALVTAIATRGLLLRFLGFELVTRNGRLAARWRVLLRAAIAWSPMLVPAFVSTALGGLPVGLTGLMAVMVASLIIQLAGAMFAIARPSRGLQDRLAGTWIVPR
jgi:eukaryotic-like serine/threonine-protein kinase